MTLASLLQYLDRAQQLIQDARKVCTTKPTDKEKVVYLMEEAQRVHEILHKVCGDFTQPYINDLAKERTESEVKRLKGVINNQKELIYKLQKQLQEVDPDLWF